MTIKASSTSKYQAGSSIQRLLQVPAIHAMFQHALHVFWWRPRRPRPSGWDMIWWMEGSKYDGWYDHWKFRNHMEPRNLKHFINLIQKLQKCRCFKKISCVIKSDWSIILPFKTVHSNDFSSSSTRGPSWKIQAPWEIRCRIRVLLVVVTWAIRQHSPAINSFFTSKKKIGIWHRYGIYGPCRL